jgi:Bor protein
MRTIAWFCVATLLTSGLTSGCAHYRVAPEGISPSTPPQIRRVHALVWGALEPRTTPDNCNGNGLSAVTVKVTAIDFFATVLTLGLWTPVTIEWTCAKTSGVPR